MSDCANGLGGLWTTYANILPICVSCKWRPCICELDIWDAHGTLAVKIRDFCFSVQLQSGSAFVWKSPQYSSLVFSGNRLSLLSFLPHLSLYPLSLSIAVFLPVLSEILLLFPARWFCLYRFSFFFLHFFFFHSLHFICVSHFFIPRRIHSSSTVSRNLGGGSLYR